MSRRSFTREFKIAAQRMQRGESASELARELDVKRTKPYDWIAEYERYGEEAFPARGWRHGDEPRVERGREDEAHIAALERKIGRQAVEIDFLQQPLRRVEGRKKGTTPDYRKLVRGARPALSTNASSRSGDWGQGRLGAIGDRGESLQLIE